MANGTLEKREQSLLEVQKKPTQYRSPHLQDNCIKLWLTPKSAPSHSPSMYREGKDEENPDQRMPISNYHAKRVKPCFCSVLETESRYVSLAVLELIEVQANLKLAQIDLPLLPKS